MQTVHKIVVFFDICSSTTILEDLLRTNNQHRWRSLLIRLKKFLFKERDSLGFLIYKFIGDGWVLVFEMERIEGNQLLDFLNRLALEYDRLFRKCLSLVLEGGNRSTGITIGMDSGPLVRLIMDQKEEFIGRPLNVAARLQGAIKQRGNRPQKNNALVSKHTFDELGLASTRFQNCLVRRELKNISGGERYQARKIFLVTQRVLKLVKSSSLRT